MAASISRRAAMRGLAVSAVASTSATGWAQVGAPTHIAAARRSNGSFALFGLNLHGRPVFEVPLPARGHAAAAHPSRALAVAFARRPGVFALVVDCAAGAVAARLAAPAGRHFYGHGAFDAEGRTLFTTENAFDDGAGVIGVWDAEDGFRRIGEFSSGGVGPHEIVWDPAGGRLVVGNGGLRTHPDSGRAKLNLETMRPNLAHLDPLTGALADVVEPPSDRRRLSLRHLSARADGLIAVAAQWQGDPYDAPPLLMTHRAGDPDLRAFHEPVEDAVALRGHAGSVAWSGDGAAVAVTAPRGGRALIWSSDGEDAPRRILRAEICGAAAAGDGFLLSDGHGGLERRSTQGATLTRSTADVAWDNHLVALRT